MIDAVGGGEIEDRKIAVLVPHGRAETELEVNQDRRGDDDASESANGGSGRTIAGNSAPQLRRGERDHHEHSQIGLGEAGVENSDFIFQQSHAQSAENPLDNDRGERRIAEIAQPAAIVRAPDPDRKDDGHESDRRGNEPMGMLEKNSTNPLRDGKEEHVVAERCRPIGDGEANALARDHSAAADQDERGDGREEARNDAAICSGVL